jgi:hypothetical protein
MRYSVFGSCRAYRLAAGLNDSLLLLVYEYSLHIVHSKAGYHFMVLL